MSHRTDNQQIDCFIESIFLSKEAMLEEELTDAYINQLTKKIGNCFSLPNENLFEALFYYQTADVPEHFLKKIQQTADRLWNEWMRRDFIYNDHELQFLRNVYQLNTQLINSDEVIQTERARRCGIQIDNTPFENFKRSLCIPRYYRTLKAVLTSLNTFIFPSSECSGLLELIMWLDMFIAFNQRFRSNDGYFSDEIDLIQLCLLDVKYKKYLCSYSIIRNIDTMQKFYIGTCSLFCALLSTHRPPQEELRWCKLVEPLLFYLHRFILESTQILEQWTDDLLYCAVGVVTLIKNYYCLRTGVEGHSALHPRLFRKYKQFFLMLLSILKQERFQKNFLSNIMSKETQLIDSVIKYMLAVSTDYDDIKYLLRAMDVPTIVVKYFETAHPQVDRNTLHLLTIICTDDDLRRLNIAEKLTLSYLQLSDNLSEQRTHQYSSMSYKSRPSNTLSEVDLNYFLLLSKNTSIQEATACLNGLRYIVKHKTNTDRKQISEIIWTLSFNPIIQKQVKKDELLLTYIREYHYNNDEERNQILWTFGDHIGLAELGLKTKDYTEQLEKIASYKLILNYSHHDAETSTTISDNLRLHGFPTFCDLSVPLLQLNALQLVKNIIICVSEYYEKSNLCRAIFQCAIKKQINIIPIIIQKHYKPQGWIKEAPVQTCILEFTEVPFIDAFETLLHILKTTKEKKCGSFCCKNYER